MKTVKKIEAYLSRTEAIRFENEHGGAYAYIQYLAYIREIVTLLRPFKKVEAQLDRLDGICWLFNEHLAFKFTHRHKLIFEEKMFETRHLFSDIRLALERYEKNVADMHGMLHAQAA